MPVHINTLEVCNLRTLEREERAIRRSSLRGLFQLYDGLHGGYTKEREGGLVSGPNRDFARGE